MNAHPFALAGALCLALSAHQGLAQDAGQLLSGEQVYRQTCVACHESGIAHAPTFRDAKAWAPLIEEGQAVLTAHAFVGVRAMPQRGGNEKLSLVEFARATAYMVREAGGNWQDPDVELMFAIRAEAEKRLDQEIATKRKLKQQLHEQNAAAQQARKR